MTLAQNHRPRLNGNKVVIFVLLILDSDSDMIQLNSKKISSWFLSLVLALVVFTSSAQDFKREYRSAKDLFAAEKYSEAMIGFKALTVYDQDNPYTEYASYYYAVSAYRLGYSSVAKDMLLHIKKMYL